MAAIPKHLLEEVPDSWADTSSPLSSSSSSKVSLVSEKLVDSRISDEKAKQDGLVKHSEEHRVQVHRSDTSAQLLSAKEWKDLNLRPDLLKGVEAAGFDHPSKIQASALPILLHTKDNMIAQSQSGTGKTACFVLTMLSIVDPTVETVQAVCTCPTRELALQIESVILKIGKFSNTQSSVLCGGDEVKKGQRIKTPIVVSTVGKLKSLFANKNIDAKKLRLFVLDEADVMLSAEGFGPEIMEIKKDFLPAECRYLLFSATYNDKVQRFAEVFAPEPRSVLRLAKTDVLRTQIHQIYVLTKNEAEKLKFLSDLYSILSVGQSIVFCGTRNSSKAVAEKLRAQNQDVSLIHGTEEKVMTAEMRDSVVADFRSGKTRVLVATDVLSRGFDVPSVTMVVNYDLPFHPMDHNAASPETYIHRIGRAGRFDAPGIAISLVTTAQDLQILKQIEEYQKKKVILLDTDVDAIEQYMKDNM
nr:ATP-dependent RNA helicase [Andalucia godoyi]